MRTTSKYAFIIFVSTIVGLIVHKKCNSETSKSIPITYDKAYVEPLYGFDETDERFVKKEVVFKKVAEMESQPVDFYNCFGGGWDGDPGDFRRIKVKLTRGHVVEYDNSPGWLEIFKKEEYSSGSIADFLKTPAKSSKIKMHPYGITLDMGKGDQILMLFGYQYGTDPARLLTLIYIGKDQAEMIFNRHFDVFEIREQQQGYSLIGRMRSVGNEVMHADPYEITIKDGKLTLEKLPLQKVYEDQDPHITLYNSTDWTRNKQPGDFTRLEIAASPSSKDPENQIFDVAYYGDVWTPFSAPITIPADTATIKQTPYFIIIENAVGRIIILNERNQRDTMAACITILRSAPYYPTSLYNHYFSLQEITEDDTAYHLLGTRKDAEDPNKIYEIIINKAAMSELRFNW
jgi:hypothetical protein